VDAATVFMAALVTALATGLGALPFLVVHRPGRTWLGTANALASGCMLGASFGLLVEGFGRGAARTAVGALAGVALIAAAGAFLHGSGPQATRRLGAGPQRAAVLIVGVMTVHSFTEGIGVGVAFGGGETLGLAIALAIAVHNIPEGLAISLVLVPRGSSVGRAAWWSIVSSLPQPLMALPAYVFVETVEPFLPVGLGFAAGAMLWIVARELVPEAVRETSPKVVAVTAAAAALAMVAFQLVLT
jgi:zinc transporter, ZIP family